MGKNLLEEEVVMETLRDLRVNLGWTINKLAEEAGVSRQAASRAEQGIPVYADTAKALTDALSRAYGRDIRPTDVKNLNIL
jgi:transcriptional regulator with XRE-family HTH domain